MNPEQLLAHFDRISDAPDAIPRLRRFILDLAVRGKLVEQDPRDEPASKLLTRIQKEKTLLVKAEKFKLLDPALDISDHEMPFTTPSSWAWVRLAIISRRIHYGFTASANPSLKTVRLLRITDIQNNSVDWSSVPGCQINADEVDQYKLDENDILIARTGGTIGKTFLVKQIPVTAVFASYLIRVQPSAELHAQYLKIFLESSVYWEQLQDGARGGGQPNVNGQTLGRMVLPIPPLAEQKRIVAKVDELMALCDRLGAAQTEREGRRDRLVASSLDRLNNGADADAFREHARFYFNHLPRLTTKPEHIQQLRQAILSLAIRGKLVPQDSNDEPADKLLTRIQAEKARLVNDGKIRKQNQQSEISEDEIPFALPPQWAWTRLGDVIHLLSGQHLQPSEYTNQDQSGPPYITGPADFGDDGLVITRYAVVRKTVAKKGQILLTVKGAGVGKTAICDLPEVAISRQLMALTAIEWSQRFLLLATHRLAETLKESARSLIPGISREDVDQFVLALPPLAEQQRIVAKVDELMALCDKLEAQLTTTHTDSRRLLEAVLHEALAPVMAS